MFQRLLLDYFSFVWNNYLLYLQLTISSANDVTFLCNALLAVRVKFLVSVHLVFSMMKVVVFTAISDFNNCRPSYQETFANGLLEISLVSTTLSVSFTTLTSRSSMDGLSVSKYILWKSTYNCIWYT